MLRDKKLSLIIPFYNDEGCPIPFVNELKKEFKKNGIEDYEIILYDDCSKDNTFAELKKLESKKIRAFRNEKNQDYGGNIMNGLAKAKGDILGWTCGDGEVTVKDVVWVYLQMKNDDDILKTIRLNRQDGWQRKYISKVFNLWSKIRFGKEIGDIKDINGYPVYFRKECYNGLGKHNVKTDWLFNIDLFRKMLKKKYKIRGVAVKHKKRFAAQSANNLKRIAKMVRGFMNYK